VFLPDQFQLLGENIVAGVARPTCCSSATPAISRPALLTIRCFISEEQFYFFCPLLLLFIARPSRPRLWLVVLAAGSLLASLSIFWGYKDWTFYSPITRAWELLGGAFLADAQRFGRWHRDRSIGVQNVLSAVGLAMILGSGLALDGNSPFPGILALPAVAGASLILASPNSMVNRQILSIRLLVWIGLVSYPLYLWHWPLLSYLTILRNGVPNFREVRATLSLSLMPVGAHVSLYRIAPPQLHAADGTETDVWTGLHRLDRHCDGCHVGI
jgi:peptidoglycan/LPS O-acetylase OafA/YrhL